MIEKIREKRLIRKGQKLLATGKLEQAYKCFEKAVMLNNSIDNLFYLGLALMSLSKYEEAKKYFSEVHEQNSENELNLLSMAECNMMQRNWLSAENRYHDLCKLYLRNEAYRSYMQRAQDVVVREKYVIGRELFAKAEKALFEKKNKEVLKYLLEAEEYDPNNANVLNNIGTLYMLDKEFEKAFKYIEKAISISPQNQKFQESFKQIKRKLRR